MRGRVPTSKPATSGREGGGGTAVGGGSSRYCVYMHIGREASYLLQGVSSPLVLELSPFSNIPSPKLSNEKPGLRIPWPDRPTNRPTSPPSRPLSLASVHRTVIFGQNRTVSYLNVSLGAPLPPPSLFPSTGGRKPYARRFSTKAGLLLLLLDSSRWRNGSRFRASLDFLSLSLSISLIPFFLGRKREG